MKMQSAKTDPLQDAQSEKQCTYLSIPPKHLEIKQTKQNSQDLNQDVPKILLTFEEENNLMSNIKMAYSTGGETSPSATSAQHISTHKKKQIKKRKKKGIKHPSIGSTQSHSSSATTHISLSSLKDADQFLKSPRFSPLPKYDRYFRDKSLQINSQYPGQQSNSLSGNFFRNIRHLPESVKQQDFNQQNLSGEEQGIIQHRSKIDIFMDCDEFNHRGSEKSLRPNQLTNRDIMRLRDSYSRQRRHKSVDGRNQNSMNSLASNSLFVSPQINSSQFSKRHCLSDAHNRDAPLLRSKSSKWLNTSEFSVPQEKQEDDFNSPLVFSTERFLKNQKRFVSDDFQLNYDGFKRNNRFIKPSYVASSYAQSIIESDSEGDDQSSQTSSLFSGTSSFRAKRNFLDVERLVDKLEPLQQMQSKFIDKIQDTIEEEKIENQDQTTSFLKKRPQIFNELKKHHKHQELILKLSEHADEASSTSSSHKMRLRSTSFTNEPIVEVQEGGANESDDIDPRHHHFRISRSISLFGQKRKKQRFHYDFRCDSPIMRPKKLDMTQHSENSSDKQQKKSHKSMKKGNSHLGYLSGSEMAIISDQESSSMYLKIKEQEQKQAASDEECENHEKQDEFEEEQNQSNSEESGGGTSQQIDQQIIVEENQNEENGSVNEQDQQEEKEEEQQKINEQEQI